MVNRTRLLAIGSAIMALSLFVTACSSSSSTETTNASSGGDSSSDGASVSNAIVKELQITLATLDYYTGSVDGVYGPETVAGIKAVQKDCGITEDGLYGPDTHACLVDLGGDA
jgi:peptidoglycan hydrolase-like protein with peptidoglycan-binding domain